MPTLSDLRTRLIFRADLPTSEPRRYSDDQLNSLLNESLQRLWGQIATWWGEDYLTAVSDTVLSAGTSTISLSSEGQKVKTLIWVREDGSSPSPSVKLPRVDLADLHRYLYSGSKRWAVGDPPRWYFAVTEPLGSPVVAAEIHLTYAPDRDETVRLVSAAQPPALSADADSVPLDWDWAEWIILDSLIRIRQRDKQDPSDVVAERGAVGQRIAKQVPERAQTEVRTVRDVYPYSGMGPRDFWHFRGDP